MLRDHAVCKFVEEQRGKEKNAGENADAPLLSRSPAGILLFELHGEGIGNGSENDDPSGMKINGYPKDFANAHSVALRHIEWSVGRAGLPVKESEAGSCPYSCRASARSFF